MTYLCFVKSFNLRQAMIPTFKKNSVTASLARNLPGNFTPLSYVFAFNPRTSFSRKQALSASPYFQKNASPRRLTRKFFRYLHNYAVTYRIAQSPGHYGKKYLASDAQGTTFSDGSFARRHGIMTRSIRFCPTSSLFCFFTLAFPLLYRC